MKFYFIRHWRTKFNLSGTMVKNYDDADIIDEKPVDWEQKVGKYIPNRDYILSSPVKSYEVQINGRSLKAVPTSSIFTEDEFLTCKSECKERFKLYTEIEDCIKRYCGE